MVLSSVGYEGTIPKEFFSTLKANDIQVLIDVRENPVSRKKGFSKNALRQSAEQNGIKYYHFPLLGSQREIRKEYRSNNNWIWFSNQYNTYLESQENEIERLFDVIWQENCCLMCFEADYTLCHRSLLIEHLQEESEQPLIINHLSLE